MLSKHKTFIKYLTYLIKLSQILVVAGYKI